jgi:signal transduction histidine kinase
MHQLFKTAREEASRLSRLVSDLLMLSQADAGMMVERAEIDLGTVVRRSFNRALPFIISNIPTAASSPFLVVW